MKEKTQKIGSILLGVGVWVGIFFLAYNSGGCDNSTDGDEGEHYEERQEDKIGKFEDGNHSATVDYYNPETGHSATYDLDVEVEDGQVIQLNFNNGGRLDDSHIDPSELDEDGNTTLEDDKGRTFDVHIEE